MFEGLLGLLPDEKIARQEERFRSKKKWAEAVDCYDINELLARKVWDLVWRYSFEIDLLTYHGPGFARALEKRMDDDDMPFRRVWSEQPNILARKIAIMPSVRTIYDPYPEHRFLYGGKGRIIEVDKAHHLLGAM